MGILHAHPNQKKWNRRSDHRKEIISFARAHHLCDDNNPAQQQNQHIPLAQFDLKTAVVKTKYGNKTQRGRQIQSIEHWDLWRVQKSRNRHGHRC